MSLPVRAVSPDSVNQLAPGTIVQVQSGALVVTPSVPDEAVAPTDSADVGVTESEHSTPCCVTVKVLSATVTVPMRWACLGLGLTE